MRGIQLSVMVVLGNACSPAAPAPATPGPMPARAPTPTAPIASTPAATNTAELAPSQPSMFHEIARGKNDQSPQLLKLGKDPFVAVGNWLWAIHDGKVDTEHYLADGLMDFGAIEHLAGHWPDAAWLTYITSNGRIGWGELYRWKETAWVKDSTLKEGVVFMGISEWSKNRQLAMALSTPIMGPPKVEFRMPEGKGALPKLTPGTGACPHAINPLGFAATVKGDVFVAGTRCDPNYPETPLPVVIEWFAPDSAKGTLLPVESNQLASTHFWDDVPFTFADRAGDEVVLGLGGQFLASFDGKAFHVIDKPDGSLVSLAYSDDGKLWAATTSGVFVRETGGKWLPRPLPAGADTPSRIVSAESAVYVQTKSAIYGPSAASAGVAVLDFAAKAAPRSFKVAWPANQFCEKNFALLYAFTKVTPADYDFPLTRKALKGKTEFSGARFVVTQEGERKYFGAIVSDYALGKKLVSVIEKEVKGSKPALLCVDPNVVRELPLDLATGQVKK